MMYDDFQKKKTSVNLWRLQSTADIVMLVAEHGHKINTNLHTNIGIHDILDTLFKADHIVLIWCDLVASFLRTFYSEKHVKTK